MSTRILTVTKTTVVPEKAGHFLTNEESLFNFWSKVAIAAPDDCWLWIGGANNMGYGQFRVGKDRVLVHRLAFMDVGGTFTKGQVLRHSCTNTACVNPAHLSAGTQKENIGDAIRAGTFKPVDGAKAARLRAAKRLAAD